MSVLSPSRIVVESLQQHVPQRDFAPSEGVEMQADTHCSACGVDMPKGSRGVWTRPGKGFTDWQYLTHPTTENLQIPLCRHCAVVFTGDFLSFQNKFRSAVYSAKGAWSLGKDAERHWLLRTPPEPPFVAYITTTMGQHVAWRAPITLDVDLLRIAVGREILSINRPQLMAVSQMCSELADSMREAGYKVTPNHPFAALDRNMTSPGHGQVRGDLRAWMLEQGLKEELHTLEALGEGELWGLSILNKSKLPEPTTTLIKDKLSGK